MEGTVPHYVKYARGFAFKMEARYHSQCEKNSINFHNWRRGVCESMSLVKKLCGGGGGRWSMAAPWAECCGLNEFHGLKPYSLPP